MTQALLVMGLVACGAVAASCGGESEGSSAPTRTSGDSATLFPKLAGEEVTWVGYGGEGQEQQQKAYLDPFAAKTKLAAKADSPFDYTKLKAQVESGQISWDLVTPDAFFGITECGTQLEKLQGVDRSKIEPRYITDGCSVPADVFTSVVAYDKSKFGDDPPTSFADFFDTEKYPGKRAVWSFAAGNQVEAALLAEGTPPDDLYPLDIEKGIAKLETIKDELVFYDTYAQAAQQMVDEQVAMSLVIANRVEGANEQGADFDFVAKDNIQSWLSWSVPKGSPNRDAAMAFLNWLASPKAQQRISKYEPLGYTTRDSSLQGTKELNRYNAVGPVLGPVAILQDQAWYAENFEELLQEYTDFVSG